MEVVTRLAIADASTLLREGLKRLLDDVNDLLVVGLAANDVETMELVEQKNKTDVLLLDLNIPKLEAVPILLAMKLGESLQSTTPFPSSFSAKRVTKLVNSGLVAGAGMISSSFR